MPKINLKKYYPFYTTDCWVEVPKEIVDELQAARRAEHAYQMKIHRYRAYYSLDLGDRIEVAALETKLQPDDIAEQRFTSQQLYYIFCRRWHNRHNDEAPRFSKDDPSDRKWVHKRCVCERPFTIGPKLHRGGKIDRRILPDP